MSGSGSVGQIESVPARVSRLPRRLLAWGRRLDRPFWAPLLLTAALCLAGAEVTAQSARTIQIELVVSRISDQPGRIDPRASKIHRNLQREFRYESLEVVQSKRLVLGIDDIGGLVLPGGKRVRVKPLLVDERGALLAVEVEGSVQTDLRVKSDHMVIIGVQRRGNGKLVISLDPHF